MNWINIKDTLPGFNVNVLTYRPTEKKYSNPSYEVPVIRTAYIVSISAEGPRWSCDCIAGKSEVTHWMPLPESPKAESPKAESPKAESPKA